MPSTIVVVSIAALTHHVDAVEEHRASVGRRDHQRAVHHVEQTVVPERRAQAVQQHEGDQHGYCRAIEKF